METRADEFVTQAREHLTVLEQVLLSLEKPGEPADNRETDRPLPSSSFIPSKGTRAFWDTRPFEPWQTPWRPCWKPCGMRRSRSRPRPSSDSSWHVTASRRSWMIWRTATERISARFSRNWSWSSIRRLRVPQPWDIDLRQVDRQRSGRLVEFFSTFERCGVVTDALHHDGVVRSDPRTSPGVDSLSGSARVLDAGGRDSPDSRIAGDRDGRSRRSTPCRSRSTWRNGCVPAGVPSARCSPISNAWGISKTPISNSDRAIWRRACPPDRSSCEAGCGLNSLGRTSIVGSGYPVHESVIRPPTAAIANHGRSGAPTGASTRIRATGRRGLGCGCPSTPRRNTIRRLRCGSASSCLTG